MTLFPRRGRHAEVRSRRDLIVRFLLLAFAADVLLTPMDGGAAPGPRLIAFAGLVVAAVYRRPGRRTTTILVCLCTGATALAVAGMGVSFDMAFNSHSEAWLNSATLWACAAAVCGLCAWRYNELRSRTAQHDLVAAIVAALDKTTGNPAG